MTTADLGTAVALDRCDSGIPALAKMATPGTLGATSELVVPASHTCLERPEVIAEVTRILKEHATPPTSRSRAAGERVRTKRSDCVAGLVGW
jgi:hypothetical protein